MRLLEYEAKSILSRYDIPVPNGQVIGDSGADISLPAVLKSQVPVGGRGKAGGIRLVSTQSDATAATDEILNLSIKGHTPTVLLAEEPLDIAREMYLSLLINRDQSSIELVAHHDGGVEIESHDTSEFYRYPLSHDLIDDVGQSLSDFLDLNEHANTLTDIVTRLYDCFTSEDITLLEINPLVLTTDNELVAADCKMELDDDAAWRHNWQFEDSPSDANFVTLDADGTVATIANGAGLAMATMDAVATAGYRPANFLDIGGGATPETIAASFRQIMAFPHVRAIVINIFGGIVQCDTVARSIITARQSIDNLPELYIRLSGTNADIAAELLAEHSITLYPTLHDALEAIA